MCAGAVTSLLTEDSHCGVRICDHLMRLDLTRHDDRRSASAPGKKEAKLTFLLSSLS